MFPIHLKPEAGDDLSFLSTCLEVGQFDLLLMFQCNTIKGLPAAWACTAYDRCRPEVFLHFGVVAGVDAQHAELGAYIQALRHHRQRHAAPPEVIIFDVAILTTSDLLAKAGNRQHTREGCLWPALNWFEKAGYRLKWHHVSVDHLE